MALEHGQGGHLDVTQKVRGIDPFNHLPDSISSSGTSAAAESNLVSLGEK